MPLMQPDQSKVNVTERVTVKKFDHTGETPVLTEVLHRENKNGEGWRNYHPLSPLNGGRIVHAREGDVICEPIRSKVAIMGANRETAGCAPLMDGDWEIWGCNGLWPLCLDAEKYFRADRWFELHPLDVQTHKELCDMIRCPVPLYTVDYETHIPDTVRFPVERVTRFMAGALNLPKDWPGYFACTFAYQIALAISEGFREIGLYGVELIQGSFREMTYEFACVSWWLGVARGMGITVTVPDHSSLTHHPFLYGLDYHKEKEWVEQQFAKRGVDSR